MRTTTFPELTAFLRHLDQSDPGDIDLQTLNFECLRELRDYVRGKNLRHLALCMESTALLIKSLLGPSPHLDRQAVRDIACHLIETVEQALNSLATAEVEVGRIDAGTAPVDEPEVLVGDHPGHRAAPPAHEDAAGGPGQKTITIEFSAESSVEDDEEVTAQDVAQAEGELPQTNGLLMGQLLVELGHVTQEQLAEALKFHQAKRLPIGECLMLLGMTSPDVILDTLKLQADLREQAAQETPGANALLEAEQAVRNIQLDGMNALIPKQRGGIDALESMATQGESKRIFLGEVLLHAGIITADKLEEAMHHHYLKHVKIGAALLAVGALSEEELERGMTLYRRLRHVAGLAPESSAA